MTTEHNSNPSPEPTPSSREEPLFKLGAESANSGQLPSEVPARPTAGGLRPHPWKQLDFIPPTPQEQPETFSLPDISNWHLTNGGKLRDSGSEYNDDPMARLERIATASLAKINILRRTSPDPEADVRRHYDTTRRRLVAEQTGYDPDAAPGIDEQEKPDADKLADWNIPDEALSPYDAKNAKATPWKEESE